MELDPSPRKWSGGIYDEARRGWLYHLEYNLQAKSAHKSEHWNKFRIEAIGNSIRVWLNGVPTADLIDDMTPCGFIALQVHGIDGDEQRAGKTVCLRNIRIKTTELEKERTLISSEIPQVSFLTNTLTEREKREGWKLLWDGKTSNGWRGTKLSNFPEKGWRIKDGILSVLKYDGMESLKGYDIMTVDILGNYILELDFLYAKGADSGIKYFVDAELNKEEEQAIGCEYQIVDDEFYVDTKMGINGNRNLTSLYDLIPANEHFYTSNKNTPKILNKYKWNRAKIVAQGNHVEHYLNGIKMVEYEFGTQIWLALVEQSRFKNRLNFGESVSGNILLQNKGMEVSFKNIKIKVID